MRVTTDGPSLVKPSVYFSPIAHPASRTPAKKRVTQTPFCMIPQVSDRKNDISCPEGQHARLYGRVAESISGRAGQDGSIAPMEGPWMGRVSA